MTENIEASEECIKKIFDSIKSEINADEKIKFCYNAHFSYSLLFLLILAIIISSIILVIQMAFFNNWYLSFFCSGALIISIAFTLGFSISFLPLHYQINNTYLLFTDQKIIVKLFGKYTTVSYQNIESMNLIERKKYYQLEVDLKDPSEVEIFEHYYILPIFIKPKDNSVLQKIEALLNKEIKKK